MPQLPNGYPFFISEMFTGDDSQIAQNQKLVSYLIGWQHHLNQAPIEIRETLNSLGSYIENTQYQMAVGHQTFGKFLGLQQWVVALLIDGSILPDHLTDEVWTAIEQIPLLWPNLERREAMEKAFGEIKAYLRR